MTIVQDGRAPPKKRPGPKPRGRSVVPLTITVTRVQRTALEALADAQQRSISAVVRQFIADGLGTDAATAP
jgi:hypothetical protein